MMSSVLCLLFKMFNRIIFKIFIEVIYFDKNDYILTVVHY